MIFALTRMASPPATTPFLELSTNASRLPENPKKLALTVLMHKLILLANRLLKNPSFSVAS